MDTIVKLYEQGDSCVYISKKVADLLSSIKLTRYQISGRESDMILDKVCTMGTQDFSFVDKTSITTKMIPVISREAMCPLKDPYDIFEEAFILFYETLSTFEGAVSEKWKQDFPLLIKTYYDLENIGKCRVYFLNNNITGAFIFENEELIKEKKIIVMPFILNDDNRFKKMYS